MNHKHYMATNTFKPGKPKSRCRNCHHKRREHYGPHEFCPVLVIVPDIGQTVDVVDVTKE